MVHNLLTCLAAYKAKMEFEGLDLDGDRPSQYREVRKEMSKIYAEDGTFGPIEISISPTPLSELSTEDKEKFNKKKQEEIASLKKGHLRIVEKLKEIRQNFSKAVTAGTRSGSGKFVYEFYEILVGIWGGSATTEPLAYGITSSLMNQQMVIDGDSRPSPSQVSDEESLNLEFDEHQPQPSAQTSFSATPQTPISRKRPATANNNVVPRLIDNKRGHLEKSLSSGQRDQIFFVRSKGGQKNLT